MIGLVKGTMRSIVKPSSAPIVTFRTNCTLPLPRFIANITPVQADGTPSPSNPLPITGWSAVNVGNSGKNLFNKNASGIIPNKYIAQDGTETTNNYFFVTDFIRIGGNKITVSGGTNSGNAPSVCFYDGAKNFISCIKHSNYSFPHIYTVPTGAVYLRESISNSDVDTFQLELGSTASTFQPYTGQTATINLGGTFYGGTLNVGTGLLTVKHGHLELNSLSWTYVPDSDYTNGGYFQSQAISTMQTATLDIKCDIYEPAGVRGKSAVIAKYGADANNVIYTANASTRVYILDSRYNDATNFKTAMEGKYIVYELATPQTYQLTPAQLTQLLGENNVWADSGDSEVDFFRRNAYFGR